MHVDLFLFLGIKSRDQLPHGHICNDTLSHALRTRQELTALQRRRLSSVTVSLRLVSVAAPGEGHIRLDMAIPTELVRRTHRCQPR